MLYNGTPLSPSKSLLPMGRPGLPSNTWFPGPTPVLNPIGISIGTAVFAGLSVTDRQTDRPCYSVGNNRPHLRTAMRPKNQATPNVGYIAICVYTGESIDTWSVICRSGKKGMFLAHSTALKSSLAASSQMFSMPMMLLDDCCMQ